MKTLLTFRFTAIIIVMGLLMSQTSCLVFHRKDNGNHKGWFKNSNNPHHPQTTNPGHTKGKSKGKSK